MCGEKKKLDWQHISRRLFLFFFPFFIATIFIMSLYTLLEWEIFAVVGSGIASYFFPPLGKETIIPVMVTALKEKGFTPFWAITTSAMSIAIVDSIVGLFLMWNFDLSLKIPLIGTGIKKMETKGGEYLRKKPRIRKTAFLGVMLFVAVPFQGSGGVGATIMGRLVGMKKEKVWYAINVGAFVGCFVIAIIGYYLGGVILDAFRSGTFQGIGAIIFIGVLLWIIYTFWYKKRNDDGLAEEINGD